MKIFRKKLSSVHAELDQGMASEMEYGRKGI